MADVRQQGFTMIFKKVLLCVIVLSLPIAASAIVFGGSSLGYMGYPSNDCAKPIKPFKPYSFDSQWEVDSYNTEVEQYNADFEAYIGCMKEYVENANNDIKRINEKIQEAIDEVRY